MALELSGTFLETIVPEHICNMPNMEMLQRHIGLAGEKSVSSDRAANGLVAVLRVEEQGNNSREATA